ncbi:unnamed protein product [Peronospora belbahrii]|uniref:Uncharacterized protein n=1 Tax=Peronospora belbahrii TaxID=622444 RepID=A0AAU9L2A0_9STRA|nr:unnamed protein product [Peronospora belbahrii]CAH0517123.1 unnamed protein product [Peronospora belbahrii]
MHPVQTQSLPTWAPSHSVSCKPTAFDDEDPVYLSGDETDCDSERGGDTLGRDDLQLMARFINLQRERARQQVTYPMARPSETRTSPILIPSQTRKYVATSTNWWLWDEGEEENAKECDQCSCCNHQSVERRSTAVLSAKRAVETRNVSTSELIFDFEL